MLQYLCDDILLTLAMSYADKYKCSALFDAIIVHFESIASL